MTERYYTVSAPIVAVASVEVLATSEEEAIEKGYEVLMDGDTNSSIHVHHDFDIEHEEVRAELSNEQDLAYALAVHVATEHFDMPASMVSEKMAATYERWQLMHASLHEHTPVPHTHEESP